jgi:hypothetical protein
VSTAQDRGFGHQKTQMILVVDQAAHRYFSFTLFDTKHTLFGYLPFPFTAVSSLFVLIVCLLVVFLS